MSKQLPADPDLMNSQRAQWAEEALDTFRRATGVDDEDAICDLVADLLHLCDRKKNTYGDFREQMERGMSHYEAETEGDEA